ncbi:MAG TPA: hypothetical protein VF981_15270 [Gemmatimonadaceae bacterium]
MTLWRSLSTLIALAFLNTAAPAQQPAQQPARCSAPEYRQFDFWIGDWKVTGANGQQAGTNRIEVMLGGCVLYESWTASGPSRGHSFNIYDPGDRKWHQTWVDNSGTLLQLAGGLVNGDMVLEGERMLPNGASRLERITWTPNSDGSVRQHWQASTDKGMRWQTVFDGMYRK